MYIYIYVLVYSVEKCLRCIVFLVIRYIFITMLCNALLNLQLLTTVSSYFLIVTNNAKIVIFSYILNSFHPILLSENLF